MEFFTYRMPTNIVLFGVLYVIAALPFLVELLRKKYWQHITTNIVDILRVRCLIICLVILLILATIHFFDMKTTLLLRNADKFLHAYIFWDFISATADGGLLGALVVLVIMLSHYYKFDYLGVIARISMISGLYCALINSILKFTLNRMRPSIDLNEWHFFVFFRGEVKELADLLYAFNSIPSGHVSFAVAVITPFILAYPNKILRTILIVWLVMVAFSRIYTQNHWFSDVIAGALLGCIIGIASYRANYWRIKCGAN